MKRKNTIRMFSIMMMSILFIIAFACKKENTDEPTVPVLTTSAVSNISATAASCGGNISSDGGAAITARGVCWSTSQTPTLSNNKTTDGADVGTFISSITGLTTGITYYVRAYATNSAGTAYGNQVGFTTLASTPTVPVLTTSAVSNISATTATGGGNITSTGGAAVTARGVCWSTSQTPTLANSITTDGTGVGSFTSSITGLTANNTYYVRAYATNSFGTAYGNQVVFTAVSGGLAVGDNYQGGIIAYIFQAGDPGYVSGETHGLIASPSDQVSTVVWNNGSYTVTAATSDTDGKTNTNTIVGIQGAGNYAAKICYDLVLGGYSDWYLPSKIELTKLYLNRTAIGGMPANYYWSSTEYAPAGAGNAWFYATFSGGYTHYGNKENTYTVRAIRSF